MIPTLQGLSDAWRLEGSQPNCTVHRIFSKRIPAGQAWRCGGDASHIEASEGPPIVAGWGCCDVSHLAASAGSLPKASLRDNRGGLGVFGGCRYKICTISPNASRSFRRLEVGFGELLGIESGSSCHIPQRCKVFQTLGGWGRGDIKCIEAASFLTI